MTEGLLSRKKGFTITELMLAVTISGVVIAAVLQVSLWSAKISKGCQEKGSAQSAAMISTAKLTSIIQNASAISNIDTNDGNWVSLSYPGGSSATLTYDETTGQLIFSSQDIDNVLLAKQGISFNRKNEGITPPIFSVVGTGTNQLPNALQVQYRVSDSTDDSNALNVGFTICLRNYTP